MNDSIKGLQVAYNQCIDIGYGESAVAIKEGIKEIEKLDGLVNTYQENRCACDIDPHEDHPRSQCEYHQNIADELATAREDLRLERKERILLGKKGGELLGKLNKARERIAADKRNILREVSSEWKTTIGDSEVTCHDRMVEGVLCRWWGDGETPKGVALIDKALVVISEPEE